MRTRDILEDSKESRHDHDSTRTNRPRRPLSQSAPCGWQKTSFRYSSIYMEHIGHEHTATSQKGFCPHETSPLENMASGKDWGHKLRTQGLPTRAFPSTSSRCQRISSHGPTNTFSEEAMHAFNTNRSEPTLGYRSIRTIQRCCTKKCITRPEHHQYKLRPPARISSIGVDRLRCEGGEINPQRCTSHCNHNAGITTCQASWARYLHSSANYQQHSIHKGLRS